MNYKDYLNNADFSNSMTTDRKHIGMLCKIVENKNMKILELGSYQGISTAAIALASNGSQITSVDLSDHILSDMRLNYWNFFGIHNIESITCDAYKFILDCGIYDFIFHDAVHGDKSMVEYIICANKTNILAIHDFEQMHKNNREYIKSLFKNCIEDFDACGRCLFIGFKGDIQ